MKTFKEFLSESSQDYKGDHMLLGRLIADCEYFIGSLPSVKRLWAGSIKGQIEKMTELFNSFPKNETPKYITLAKIKEYGKLMTKLDK